LEPAATTSRFDATAASANANVGKEMDKEGGLIPLLFSYWLSSMLIPNFYLLYCHIFAPPQCDSILASGI